MTDQTVALEILAQLGGPSFRAMTGAKHLTSSADSLSFQLPRFSGVKVTAVRVTLDADDTYTVCFYHGRGVKMRPAKTLKGVYCEDLARQFRDETGLETRMPTFARRAVA